MRFQSRLSSDDFPSTILIKPGTEVKVKDKIYTTVSKMILSYIDIGGQWAGMYFFTPTGDTIRQAPNLEYGDVGTQSINLVEKLAARYDNLASRIENLCENERAAFKKLSYFFRIVETA